ncbi:MAG: putative Ig domain-containing protein, partial [Acidobacteriota bacterium]
MKRVLNNLKLKSLILLISFLCLTHQAFATTVILPADDDLIISARAIVRGKVLSVMSAYDEQQDRIYTYVVVKVQEVLKGDITERRIVLKELGGTVGDRSMIIFGNPQFAAGEQTLLYLDTWADGSLRTHQMFMGKFNIYDDPSTGQRMVVRSSPDKNTEVLQFQPHANHSHGPSTEKMELSAYLSMARQRLAANLDESVRFEYQYYRDVPLLAEPAEYDRLARNGNLQAQFTLLGGFRFFEPDSGQPVICMVKPTNTPSPETVNDMAGAMGAWSNVSGCSLQVASGGQLSACYTTTGLQGIGIVFDNCDGRNSPSSGCASTLAWGGISLTGPGTRVINGTTFRQTTQGFVSFNPYASCHFINRCNVQEIATHEIGHALGLGHSADSSATMAAFAHFDGRCASIRTDDEAGIRFIYPSSGGGGGVLTITTSTLPNGTVGTSYSQSLAASGGTPSYTWSLASGSGPLPTGLNLGSNGVISGTPSAAGTFNFTVRVTDSQQATAQKPLSITIGGGGPQYDSQFVSQDVPTTLNPGQSFNATLRWTNTGSQTWLGSNGFRLGSQNPADNRTWGGNAVIVSGLVINPGQQFNVTFTAFAPTTPGTYDFQWQCFQTGVGFFGQLSTNVRITVSQPPSSPTVTSPSPLEAAQGSAFTHQLAATGGTTPYTWSIVSGALPPGLNLAGGVISGTPSAAGSFAFTAQVKDSQSRTGQKSITINVSPPPLSITTSSLANAMRGAAYNQPLSATGGTQPYTWAITGGNLPAGLSLANGAISGTPTVTGTFPLTVRATDSQSRTATRDFNLTVLAAPELKLNLASRMETAIGTAFNYQPSATGGVGPYSWSVTSGSLPSGLSLNPATGAISGSPSQAG